MMSYESLRQAQDEAAERAAQEGMVPYVPFDREEVEQMGARRGFPFPNLGTYEPPGWKQVKNWESYRDQNGLWFVDKSGFGREDEPALTVKAFRASLLRYYDRYPDHGYAIVEEGPFQVHISAFEPADKLATHNMTVRRRGDGWTM